MVESASTPADKIGAAIDAEQSDNAEALHELRSVLVSVDGEVMTERYFGSDPTEHADLQSVTKSVVSTLVGIATGEGAISSVDAPLEDLLPEYRQDMDDRARATTLRQLLTMTAGWTDTTLTDNRDLLRGWFRDGSKLGQLYLDDSKWHGKQIVPADWIQQATAAEAPNGYGYLWWIHPVQGRHGYAAIGSDGQVILVVPDRRLIVVASSRVVGPDDGGDPIFRLVDSAVIPNLP